jgi:hypothetical protein
MAKAARVHSTPPTNTSATRRRFLTQAATAAASGTVLSLATVSPTPAAAAPTGLPDRSDERLVAAAEGLIASQAAIDQLYREHDYADGYGEVDERADCQALFAVQDQHVETLVTVPATSNAGLRAKASVVAAKFMADGFRPDHKRLAVSLANDLVGGTRAAIPATPALAAPAGSPDSAFTLIAEKRAADLAHCEALGVQGEFERRRDYSSDAAIEALEGSEAACHYANEVDWKLATTLPTTIVGVAAVLRFANEIEDAGNEWPDTDAIGPDGWHYQLRATMAAAIEALIKAQAGNAVQS